MRRTTLIALLAPLGFLTVDTAYAAKAAANAPLLKLFDATWQEDLADDPLSATALGDPRYVVDACLHRFARLSTAIILEQSMGICFYIRHYTRGRTARRKLSCNIAFFIFTRRVAEGQIESWKRWHFIPKDISRFSIWHFSVADHKCRGYDQSNGICQKR